MPFLQRVRAELRLRKPPAPQEVMCYIIWVHVWVGTRSSGQHLPYQNTKGPLHQRGREESLQGLSLELTDVLYQWSIFLFYIRLGSKFSPHLIWRWIFGSVDSRWPSTWRAASPSCGSERCNTLCPKHLWPCRSLPPWPCTTRPAWTQTNETAFLCHKNLSGKEAAAAALHVRDLHAVACCKISVHKFLLGQILHSRGNLQPEADQILHSRVLKQIQKRLKKLEKLHSNDQKVLHTNLAAHFHGFRLAALSSPSCHSGWSAAGPRVSCRAAPLEGALLEAGGSREERGRYSDGSPSWWCPPSGTAPLPLHLLSLMNYTYRKDSI